MYKHFKDINYCLDYSDAATVSSDHTTVNFTNTTQAKPTKDICKKNK